MKLEDKKFIAEQIGWSSHCTIGPVKENIKNIQDGKDWNYFCEWDKWNPDTDHEQFAEVKKKISNGQWGTITDKYRTVINYYLLMEDAILFDLPKVMEIVLTVLKAENNGGK